VPNEDVLSDCSNRRNERFKLMDNDIRLERISELKEKMEIILQSFRPDGFLSLFDHDGHSLLRMLRKMVKGRISTPTRYADFVLQCIKQMQTDELSMFSPSSEA
jgi:hypothetical protein